MTRGILALDLGSLDLGSHSCIPLRDTSTWRLFPHLGTRCRPSLSFNVLQRCKD
jgi:hypothetical protein